VARVEALAAGLERSNENVLGKNDDDMLLVSWTKTCDL